MGHTRSYVLSAIAALAMGLTSVPAAAQYKNTSFGLDAAGILIDRPSLVDANQAQLGVTALPIRLAYGLRLGGEFNLKLHEDHWWVSTRLNGSFYSYDASRDTPGSVEAIYDAAAAQTMGTVLGLEGLVGLRYYFLTDQIRPFAQIGVSYSHLFTFTGQGDTVCQLSSGYACSGSNSDNFLPHTNLFLLHAPQLGIEFVVVRDLAITLAFDLQRWFIVNATDNWAFVGSLGVTFYG